MDREKAFHWESHPMVRAWRVAAKRAVCIIDLNGAAELGCPLPAISNGVGKSVENRALHHGLRQIFRPKD